MISFKRFSKRATIACKSWGKPPFFARQIIRKKFMLMTLKRVTGLGIYKQFIYMVLTNRFGSSGLQIPKIETLYSQVYAGKPKVALRFLMLTQTWAFVREIIQYLVITLGNYLTLDFRLGKRKFFKGFIQTICFITKFRISEYANAQFRVAKI